MKRISRRELFATFAAAPFLAALGRPKPKKFRGKFRAFFKYYYRSPAPSEFAMMIFHQREIK